MFSCRDPEGYLWNIGSYDPWNAPAQWKAHGTAAANLNRTEGVTPSWRIGAGRLRFAHPPYELLGKSIHAQHHSIAPRPDNEAR